MKTGIPAGSRLGPYEILGPSVGSMSPEQASGRASGRPLNFRFNQFSLASIHYEITSAQKA